MTRSCEISTVIVRQQDVVIRDQVVCEVLIIEQGRPGPPGPGGGGGGGTYIHRQIIAAAVWTVPHNLHRRPSITVVDNLGNVVIPDVQYISDDIVQIINGLPMTGSVYCN